MNLFYFFIFCILPKLSLYRAVTAVNLDPDIVKEMTGSHNTINEGEMRKGGFDGHQLERRAGERTGWRGVKYSTRVERGCQ